MKCPKCRTAFHETDENVQVLNDYVTSEELAEVHYDRCPECGQVIVNLAIGRGGWELVYPPVHQRLDLSESVPAPYWQDYLEAVNVLPASSKASAALSRRCLQRLIREHFGLGKKTLEQEIAAVLALQSLPSQLAADLDAVRVVGNFAAHPMKNLETGEVIDVEPGEVEWVLDVLEGLFDFCFVQSVQAQRRREDLNRKLEAAGKPPLGAPQPH